jgi:ABC-type polysaccharide/polyol phosphate transport system ATPase subunit
MDDDVVISIKGLRKSYRVIDPQVSKGKLKLNKMMEYPIFEDLDLEIRKGDIVGILGRNGCGKSTFLKIVSGIVEPDAGTVEVRGKVASILELSMGFHNDLSGRDNIILRSELYGIPRKEVMENIEEIIEYSDLGIFIDNPVRTYSSGMRSRLAFSVMVNVDADIFLVDEALSTGDMAFASKASEHLKNLVRSGKTVLFTSHSMGTIKRTCNRAIWISDRKISMDGPADDVVEAYSRSINDSFEETLSLANGGSSSAQYRLSTFYRDGIGVGRDPTEQRRWLEAASEREHPMAMAELGDILLSEGDRAGAEALYKAAAENGNFDARRKYSTMKGEGRREIDELKEVMKELAQSGFPYDLYNYGNLLFKTAMTRSDYEEAFAYLSKASELGWTEANIPLSQMYREGTGVERDIGKSIETLERAAENGNTRAMSLAANNFLEGNYFPRDPERAFKWFMRSALTGNSRSQYQVAIMLSSGLGTEKDEEKANEWFIRYSSTMVNDSRRIAMDTMRKRKMDDPRSNDILKAASMSYDVNSMVTLATRYETGRGFKKKHDAYVDLMQKASIGAGAPRTRLGEICLEEGSKDYDPDRAMELLRSAAGSGDARAMYRLSVIYKEGKICEQDMEMHRMYLTMAAERGNKDAKLVLEGKNPRDFSNDTAKEKKNAKTGRKPKGKTGGKKKKKE